VPISADQNFIFKQRSKSKKLEKDGNRFRLLFIETPKFKTAYFMAFLDDENDDNIVKKSNYLKKDKKYNGLVLYFNLNGDFVIGEKINNGKRTAYALKSKGNNGAKKQESTKATNTESLNCTTEIIEYWYQDCYYTLDGDLIRCDAQVVYDVEIITYCEGNPPEGGGGGGNGGSNCNGGGSAGPLTINTVDPSDPNNPIPPPCDENPPPLDVDTLIIDFCQQLTTSMQEKITESIDRYRANNGDLISCTNRYIYNLLEQNNVSINFCIEQGIPSAAKYDPSLNKITFESEGTMSTGVLSEEFFHAYQNIDYGGIQNMTTASTGYFHIEFEHALLRDLISSNAPSQSLTFNSNPSIKFDYVIWLSAIKQSGNLPKSISDLNVSGFTYSFFLEEFQKMRSTTPVSNTSFTPNAMFNLFKNLNCN
jgi:hypothetical protein